MQPAQARLAVELKGLRSTTSRTPMVTNTDAKPIAAGPEARDALVRQVSQPVRWLESVEFLISQGVTKLGRDWTRKVLSGLARQSDRSLRCVNVEDKV